ncbi:head-tail connector protein [Ehrlichia muris]|uniref:head-tail connector protein n=1 Tax=Ehrlichia muris TaxID=35795 RepID=UPI0037C18866
MLENSMLCITRKTVPTSLPITLSEVKSFLRINNNQDDILINNLITMASEYAQWYIEKSLMKQTWEISCSSYIPGKIQLLFNPIIKVNYVKTIHTNGSEEFIDQKYYHVDTLLSYISFNKQIHGDRIEILYEAGYTDNALIPAQIRHGILHHVAISYKNRESENINNLTFIKNIYSPFRELKLVL